MLCGVGLVSCRVGIGCRVLGVKRRRLYRKGTSSLVIVFCPTIPSTVNSAGGWKLRYCSVSLASERLCRLLCHIINQV